MRIYTRTGDGGETELLGRKRGRKDHPLIVARGELDELGSCLGLALSSFPASEESSAPRKALLRVQEELFRLGALLSARRARTNWTGEATARLESEIDAMSAGLPPLNRFLLPGGSPPGAALHLARAVCRRAERALAGLGRNAPVGAVAYLNRLSDHLFVCARWVNRRLKATETLWTP